MMKPSVLSEKKFIITGGPTREWLDPVRFISNPSSGKMGIALADKAFDLSKNVVFIHGPIDNELLREKSYKIEKIETTIDMLQSVVSELTPNSVLIMAAAPGDYRSENISPEKIKKNEETITITLRKNPDILKEIAVLKKKDPELKGIITVGFAAETVNIEEYAKKKLIEKSLDLICLNDVSRKGAGFNSATNIITVYTRLDEKIELPLMSKIEAAEQILKITERFCLL